MKIRAIATENFRAFSSVNLPLAPFTVLVGANGLGKSSLFHPLLLLKQSFEAFNKQAPYDIHIAGRYVNYGEAKNVFHMANYSRPVAISITFDDEMVAPLIKQSIDWEEHNAQMLISKLVRELEYVEGRPSRSRRRSESELRELKTYVEKYTSVRSTPPRNFNLLQALADGAEVVQDARVVEFQHLLLGPENRPEQDKKIFNNQREKLVGLYTLWKTITDFRTTEMLLKFTCVNSPDDKEKGLRIVSLGLFVKGVQIAQANFADLKKIALTSVSKNEPVFIDRASTTTSTLELLCTQIRGRGAFPAIENDFGVFIFNMLATCVRSLQKSLIGEQLVHVGPFRASPQRYYDQTSADGLRERTIKMITQLQERPSVNTELSKWWKRVSKVSFEGRQLSGALYSVLVHPIWLSGNNSVQDQELTLVDTGHGYSQILPVMIEILIAPPGCIVIVEQPEAHLHPNLHPEITDWLIEQLKSRSDGTVLIVETHSEYILRRLSRRTAEEVISPRETKILTIEATDSGKPIANEIDIADNGTFDWPVGFYEQTLEDNVAIGKAQRSKR